MSNMKTSEELYNVKGTHFKGMLYEEVLTERIKLAKILIDDLQEFHYSVRDYERVGKSFDSIKFNTKLLDEYRGEL